MNIYMGYVEYKIDFEVIIYFLQGLYRLFGIKDLAYQLQPELPTL